MTEKKHPGDQMTHPQDQAQVDITCGHCVTLLMAKRTQDALREMGLAGVETQLIPEPMLICAILTAARADDVLALLAAPRGRRTDPHEADAGFPMPEGAPS